MQFHIEPRHFVGLRAKAATPLPAGGKHAFQTPSETRNIINPMSGSSSTSKEDQRARKTALTGGILDS